MNIFNDAIEMHAQWKMTLKRHIEEGVIQDIKKVGDCHACNLGRWIYGDGVRYNRLPSFESMCIVPMNTSTELPLKWLCIAMQIIRRKQDHY